MLVMRVDDLTLFSAMFIRKIQLFYYQMRDVFIFEEFGGTRPRNLCKIKLLNLPLKCKKPIIIIQSIHGLHWMLEPFQWNYGHMGEKINPPTNSHRVLTYFPVLSSCGKNIPQHGESPSVAIAALHSHGSNAPREWHHFQNSNTWAPQSNISFTTSNKARAPSAAACNTTPRV